MNKKQSNIKKHENIYLHIKKRTAKHLCVIPVWLITIWFISACQSFIWSLDAIFLDKISLWTILPVASVLIVGSIWLIFIPILIHKYIEDTD